MSIAYCPFCNEEIDNPDDLDDTDLTMAAMSGGIRCHDCGKLYPYAQEYLANALVNRVFVR